MPDAAEITIYARFFIATDSAASVAPDLRAEALGDVAEKAQTLRPMIGSQTRLLLQLPQESLRSRDAVPDTWQDQGATTGSGI